ncbi:MAG TPA: TolC family protein [Gemmatimonadaceae bacterium]|nr:TolC family protein [Gemmatimonadaceae bacterium]
MHGYRIHTLIAALGLVWSAVAPPDARAQENATPLSLDDAIVMAERGSESVGIARAGVTRSRGEIRRARSELFPQLSGSASYSRALASEFEGISLGPPDMRPLCRAFLPPSAGLTPAERLDTLEAAVALATDCQPDGGGIDFSELPFGRENTFRLGLNATQTLFSGGRVVAQSRAAAAGRRTAEIALASARAQLVLNVTQAYYDAVLSERLLEIAEATLVQAETTLTQTRLALQVGTQPEFDALRAQVTRDNQLPIVVRRRTDRELALMRLKQLVSVPLEETIRLTTQLGDTTGVPPVRVAGVEIAPADTAASTRAPVRQAAEAVEVQENLLRIAASQRLPAVSLSSQYGRVAYPETGLPGWSDFRANWNVGVSLALPIFTGGRISGDVLVAEADLAEQQFRLEQVEELAQLDTRSALAELAAAEAQWQASAGTVEQADRAYLIAEVRYREGISTQTELSDSRIMLQQAQANRAMAARDRAVARVRVALLRDLPLGTGAQAGGAGGQGSGATGGSEGQSQQRPRQATTAAATQASFGAGVP